MLVKLAFDEGYALGLRDGAKQERERMEPLVERRARILMQEHYDADLYKRAFEEHLRVCNRPILMPLPTAPPVAEVEADREGTPPAISSGQEPVAKCAPVTSEKGTEAKAE